jgi:hypothetical protein
MKTSALALLVFLAVSVSAGDEPASLTGTIVDMHCYIARDAKGEDHAGCANACISRDVPAGFIAEDGTLYLLIGEKPVSVKEKVAGKAGKKVTVKGKVVERAGVKAIQLASVD